MRFLLKETYRIIKSNISTYLLIFSFISFSFLLIGSSTLLLLNYKKIENILSNRIEAKIFFKDGVNLNEIKKFNAEIQNNRIVKSISFIDKKAAREVLKSKLDIENEILNDIDLPYSTTIKFENSTKKEVFEFLNQNSESEIVDSVIYPKLLLIKLIENAKYLMLFFLLFSLLGFVIVLLLNKKMFSIIIRNDRRNIIIKEYVGASFKKIVLPYYFSSYFIILLVLLLSNITIILVKSFILTSYLQNIILDKYLILTNIVVLFFSLMLGLYQLPNKKIINLLGK